MKKKPAPRAKLKISIFPNAPQALMDELREWIQQARVAAARVVDEHLCALYWRIGTRIRMEIFKDQRAEYGARIVSALRRQLTWTHFKLEDTGGYRELMDTGTLVTK